MLADTDALAVASPDGRRADLDATLDVWVEVLSRIATELDTLHFSHQLPQRAVVPTRHPSSGLGVASVGA
jgi:hypothetical protein